MNREQENDSFKDSEVELIVADAYHRGVSRGMTRVDPKIMENLNCKVEKS